MKRKFLLLLTAYMGCIFATYAFNLASTPSEDITPVRTIQLDDNGYTVSYSFPGAVSMTDDLFPQSKSIEIPGFGNNLTLGEPAWPVRIDTFEIPDGYDAEVTIINEAWTDLNLSLAPARPLLIDSSDETYSLDNVPAVQPFNGVKPASPVRKSNIQTYRDRSILYVNVMPVKCLGNNQTKICENLTYKVTFTPSESDAAISPEKVIHEVDRNLMQTMFTACLPDADVEAARVAGETKWVDAPYYLILSSTKYSSSIDKFIEWKKCMGFNANVLYARSWTTDDIKNAITTVYNSVRSLQYVLLIGDAKLLPPVKHLAKETNSNYDHYSDFTYGCMDGEDDMEQDVIIGRLSVSDATEASVVIDKIIGYEKNPPYNSHFYNNAIHAAYFQDDAPLLHYEDRRFTRTSEDIRNGLANEDFNINRIYYANANVVPTHWNKGSYAYGESLPQELLKPTFQWAGSTEDIINGINTGAFYVLHRGHGSWKGWAQPEFLIEHIASLTNGSMLPVCFSINCQSGAYGNTIVRGSGNKPISQSFSEAFLRKANGGAVGVIAASETSYSGVNDAFTMEMFQSIWPKTSILTTFPGYEVDEIDHDAQPVYALGKILLKGKAGITQKYSDHTGKYVPYTKRIFNLYGDPSTQMYTARPQNITFVPNTMENVITVAENVQASIILNDGSVLVATGTEFNFEPYTDEIAKVTYSGHNLIPSNGGSGIVMMSAAYESGFTNIEITSDCIYLTYDAPADSDVMIRLRSIFNSNSINIQLPSDANGSATISTSGLASGIYIIELIVDGELTDSKKVII